MTNDNTFGREELPPGASVFGDVEPSSGASVFGESQRSGSSVFTEVDTSIDIDQVPTAAIESENASVFGDLGSSKAADDSPRIISDPVSEDDDITIVSIDSSKDDANSNGDEEDADPIALDLRSADKVKDDIVDDIDDGSNDPVDLAAVEIGADAEGDSDDIELPDPTAAHSFGDDIERGEPIALDVDPDDDDGMQAWSDLGSRKPRWGSSDEDADLDSTGSWDPGTAGPPDKEIVKIGAVESDDFFEFDDGTPVSANQIADDTADVAKSNSDLQPRVITGVALLAVAVIAFTLHPLLALALIVVVVALAAGEFFNALRVAGYQPATLLGLAATVAMPLAVYARGTQAVAMILALTVVFGLLWYIVGVATEMPVMNLGVTLLGVVYIGVLGSFGAAMLENANGATFSNDDGAELLLIALVLTIAYDIGAYFSGRSMGRTPLTAISPNKTVEGLFGGAVMTVVAAVVFVSLLGQFVAPIGDNVTIFEALLLGLAAAVMAPLGDLGESLIKRDLGIKDMGSILPGHGGVLDRVDALLFVLPTVYFFALAFVYA